MLEAISSFVGGAFSLVGSIVNANSQEAIARTQLESTEVQLQIAKTQGATATQIALLENKKVQLQADVTKEIAASKAKNSFYGMILLFLGLIIFVIYKITNKKLDNEKLNIINNAPERQKIA
jgi:hypothetical protein